MTFRCRQNDGTQKNCTVSGQEFVRRFLQLVLPKGFHRVRYYGWPRRSVRLFVVACEGVKFQGAKDVTRPLRGWLGAAANPVGTPADDDPTG